MTTYDMTEKPSLALRLLHAIPVFGWMIRDVSRDLGNLPYALITLLTLLVLGFQLWGPVVFTLAALCVVPCMFVFFVAISWPFPSKR